MKNLLFIFAALLILIGCNSQPENAADSINKDSGTKEQTASVKTGIIKTGSSSVEYFIEGEGSPIILLPGGSLNTVYLAPLAKELSNAGYQVVRINPRGTGQSTGDTSQVTMHDLGNDVAEVIKALGLGKVDIAGHAFGNRIARVVANDHPDLVRSVILLAAGGAVPPKEDAQTALDVIFNPSSTENQIIGSMSYMVGDSNYYASAWEIVKQSRSPKAAGIQSLAMKSTLVSDWSAPKGNAPMLVLQGSNDQVAPPANGELLKKQFPDRVTLVSIEGAGHMIVIERAQETTKAIIDFLSSLKLKKD